MNNRKGPQYQLSKVANNWRWFEYPGRLGTFGIINPERRTVAKCCPLEGWLRHLYGRNLFEEETAYSIAVYECHCPISVRVEKQEEPLSQYAVFCNFADDSTREFNIFISREAGEAEFIFQALSALKPEERQKLTSLGTLRIASMSEPSLVADGEHWLRRSKLIHTNRYPFTVATK